MANQVLYGFYSLKDLMTERVTTVSVGTVQTAIDQSVAEHNRTLNAFMALFAMRTTNYKLRYRTAALARSQPLDEYGRARPIKRAGFYDLAWPIQASGNAWGADFIMREKMTVQEANNVLAALLTGDMRWMRDHMLAALFANASWAWADDEYGDLTIYGPANGDSVTYQIVGGADSGTTDNHFLAQASGIADGSNPYPAIYNDLVEHPENGQQVVAFIPSGLVATTEALTNFRGMQDPDVTPGSGTSVLTGSLGVNVPGKIIGKSDRVWIAEWDSLPAGYILATTTDGDPALAMREDPETNLQGFTAVAERDDYPFWERQYLRRAGFGAWNRTNAVVYQIGNASYSVPTGYATPLA